MPGNERPSSSFKKSHEEEIRSKKVTIQNEDELHVNSPQKSGFRPKSDSH